MSKERTTPEISDQERGLYNKFIVKRADGSSAPGEKHANCEYLVLDIQHDKFAIPALTAYAEACATEYPIVAEELRVLISKQNNKS